VRGVWDLIVACKGSVVVAWRRGGFRTGLLGVLAAVAMVGAVGALWLIAGGDGSGRDAATPADHTAAPDRHGPDNDAAGRGRPEWSELTRRWPSARGAWRTETMERAAAVSGAPGEGPVPGSGSGDGDPGPASQTASAVPSGPGSAPASQQRRGSPSTSTSATTSPPGPESPAGGATTSTTAPGPLPDGTGAGDGAGGLLGGLLDVLGLG
jgi:hypothetical protein